jgi:hypothetical protein
LQRFQPYLYQPCCYAVGVPIWSKPARHEHGVRSRPPRAVRRK